MASLSPFPYMPPKSTELRLDHFDELVYTADSTTILYKFLDAMCGDAGAGSLKKEIFIQRLQGALDTIYGSDLDFIFGNMKLLSRTTAESYTYDPMTDMLTSEMWDEVRIKDAWYRARITEYFVACALGSQTDGLRTGTHAAIGVDCEILELWHYIDDFGLADYPGYLGRSNSRNEVVVKPHKLEITQSEKRTLTDMLRRFIPIDVVLTIDPDGLSVSAPVILHSIAADSSYFQVEKIVDANPDLDQIPPPELLAIDLDPSEKWLFSKFPCLAPHAQFNMTCEYGFYYLISGGTWSQIDGVAYETLGEDGILHPEANFEFYENTGSFTDWIPYDKADSPDNYPGGKYGLHPYEAPALNPDQSPYQFPHESQAAYLEEKQAEVHRLGGIATDMHYRLPIEKPGQHRRTYTPDQAIAFTAPARDSTVTSSATARRPRLGRLEARDTSIFVRA